VFESDQDEEDFLDSLKRIVINYNNKVFPFSFILYPSRNFIEGGQQQQPQEHLTS